MKKHNVAVCILLSLFTCSIYNIYWIIRLENDINRLTDKKRISGAALLGLFLITCGVYGFFWVYLAGNDLDELKEKRGMQSNNLGFFYVIIWLISIGIVPLAILQNEVNTEIDYKSR